MKQLSLEFGRKDLRKAFDSANLEEFVATLILAAFPNQVSIVKLQGRFSTQLQTKSFHHKSDNFFLHQCYFFSEKKHDYSQNKLRKQIVIFCGNARIMECPIFAKLSYFTLPILSNFAWALKWASFMDAPLGSIHKQLLLRGGKRVFPLKADLLHKPI